MQISSIAGVDLVLAGLLLTCSFAADLYGLRLDSSFDEGSGFGAGFGIDGLRVRANSDLGCCGFGVDFDRLAVSQRISLRQVSVQTPEKIPVQPPMPQM